MSWRHWWRHQTNFCFKIFRFWLKKLQIRRKFVANNNLLQNWRKAIKVVYYVFSMNSDSKKLRCSGKRFSIYSLSKGMQNTRLNHQIPFLLWRHKVTWWCCDDSGIVWKNSLAKITPKNFQHCTRIYKMKKILIRITSWSRVMPSSLPEPNF